MAHTASPFGTYIVSGFNLVTQCIKWPVRNRRVKCGVTYVSFVCKHAVRFSGGDFPCGNLHKEEIVRKAS
jgi:hypothetical protein